MFFSRCFCSWPDCWIANLQLRALSSGAEKEKKVWAWKSSHEGGNRSKVTLEVQTVQRSKQRTHLQDVVQEETGSEWLKNRVRAWERSMKLTIKYVMQNEMRLFWVCPRSSNSSSGRKKETYTVEAAAFPLMGLMGLNGSNFMFWEAER